MREIKKLEASIKDLQKTVNEKMGLKETDTGLAPPNLWDLNADRQRMKEEQPLQVTRQPARLQILHISGAFYNNNLCEHFFLGL